MEIAARARLLEKTPFGGLGEGVSRLAALFVEQRLAAGALVFSEGEIAGRFFVLAFGRLRAYRTLPGGREITVFVLQPGFDKPNELGLDWGYVVLMFWVFGVSWLAGAVLAWFCRKRRVLYLAIHGLLSPLFVFALWCGYRVYFK